MDIRAYFSSNRKKDNQSKTKSSSEFKPRKRIIESDSEDEKDSNVKSRKRKSNTVVAKRKAPALSDSSGSDDDKKSSSTSKLKLNGPSSKRSKNSRTLDSSSEEVSPAPKQKQLQKKLSLTIKSKFFKETSAADVFGDQPIKRDNTRLLEIQSKLKKNVNISENHIKLEDDDDFEAAMLQVDDIGNNWVDSKEMKSDQTSIQKEPEKVESSLTKKEIKYPKKEDKIKPRNKGKESESPPKKEKIKSPKKNVAKKVIELEVETNRRSPRKRKAEAFDVTESPPKKLSIKDKLKRFSAFVNSEKCVSEEILPKEKLLSKIVETSPPSSGYSSMCSSSQESQSTNDGDFKVPIVTLGRVENDESSQRTNENFSDMKSPQAPKVQEKKIKEIGVQKIFISEDCFPWVEKYKPDSTKKIIGQQGDKSNVKKLTNWLNDWYKNNGNKKAKFVPSGWNKDPTGACFKAALLSGPPGVGKTTSVTLICKELGFDAVEFNASDTRSKKLLQEEVGKMLTNTSLMSHYGSDSSLSVTKKHVLVMDEVDGMAGNEDRGGIQELIQLIKITKVPIICMCNDRNHPKIRSLVNYCFDLRFQRPRIEQIKGYMRTVCFKEKLNVSNDDLTNIITSSNNDVRLVLNHLSMLAADKGSSLDASKKYVKLNPWDVLRKVFSKEDHKTMSIHDKCDLFFYDYSIAPLFIQENYLTVKPLNVQSEDKCKKMKLFAMAADSISIGDSVDNQIRSRSAWSLLPTQAIFSSYVPGELLEGYCTSQINFPAWLGKNSRKGKIDRLLQEIQIHTRLKISGSKEAVGLEYAPYLRTRIVEPMIKNGSEGAKESLEMLHSYDLLKDDLESLNQICSWTNSLDPMSTLDSKVKAAFTRLYNKNPPVRPYSLSAPIKKKLASDKLEEEDNEGDEEGEEEEVDNADAMIIVKKKPSKQNNDTIASTSKVKPKPAKETSKKGKKK